MDSIVKDLDKFKFQVEIEKRYNKHQLLRILKEDFRATPEVMETINNNNLEPDMTLTCLAQLAIRKRVPIETMVGLLRKYGDTLDDVANKIYAIGVAQLYTCTPDYGTLITKYSPDPELQERIDKFQFIPPMVIRPKKLRTNKDNEYITFHTNPVLKARNTQYDICLDHLNRVNRIPLVLNMDVAYTLKCEWKNIDHPKADETYEEWCQRKRLFDKYVEKAHETMELINIFDCFYETYGYDRRGRVYPHGYHINHQGNDWNKACIELFNKELVNGL